MNEFMAQKKKVESILRILRNRLIAGKPTPLCYSLFSGIGQGVERLVLKRIFQTLSNRFLFGYIGIETHGYYLGIAPENKEFFVKRIELLDYLIDNSGNLACACLLWNEIRKTNRLVNVQDSFVKYVKRELFKRQIALCLILMASENNFNGLRDFAMCLLDVVSKAPEVRKLTNSSVSYFLLDPRSMEIKNNKYFRTSLLESLIYVY